MNVILKMMQLFKMAPEGDGTGGGGGGTSLLNQDLGGQGGGAGGAGGTGGDKGGGGAGDKGNQGDGKGNLDGTGAKTWLDGLPDDLKGDASLKRFTDVPNLAKAYKNLESQLGKDRITVPGPHTTDEEWQAIYKKMGLPDPDKYEIKGEGLKDDVLKDFKAAAHKAGLLPKQAQAAIDWFVAREAQFDKLEADARVKALADTKAALEKEWGQDFKHEMLRTQALIKNHGSPEFVKFLDESGFGNNIHVAKFLNSLAKGAFKEDTEVAGDTGGAGAQVAPSDARKQATDITANPKNPSYAAYHDAAHPNHKAAVKEVQDLWDIVYPPAKSS